MNICVGDIDVWRFECVMLVAANVLQYLQDMDVL